MSLPLARFHPALIDALRGYDRARWAQDVGAGLTVAAVALPLAMAFAVASGLPPSAGLITAIVAGFLISALGGSRVQIGGPAGAFIVIVYGIVERYGVANLVLATALSGVLLFAMGLFRLGTLVRFIPIAVVIGFTNGIAVLIALSQLKDFFGLKVPHMPADFFSVIGALWGHRASANPWALGVAVASLALVLGWPRITARVARRWPQRAWIARVPGPIVALVLATALIALLRLPVETIGTRFGGIPARWPDLALPAFSWASAQFLLVPAITLALLGAIESLLCARVADGMTGDRHDPNQELMAQGIANFVTPFLGGMPATGTIARTVTNVKSGASSPVAGMVHALVLLVVVAAAAPLAAAIPLAALAAILMAVAWNMGDWRAFGRLRSYRLPYRGTLLAVFVLTVVFDLTVAVQVGIAAACLTFIYRLASLSRAEPVPATEFPSLAPLAGEVAAWRLHGALFFGATPVLERVGAALPTRAVVIDMAHVLYVDSTGAEALEQLLQRAQEAGVRLIISGLSAQPADIARRTGLLAAWQAQGEDSVQPDLAQALGVASGGGSATSAPVAPAAPAA